jgi:starch synthase (maltosyl-transferring)
MAFFGDPVVTETQRPLPPPRCPVVIEALEPLVDGGRFRAKAVVGTPVVVRADVFAHGHFLVRALLRTRPEGGACWHEVPMRPMGNDRFEANVVPKALGRLEVEVLGEIDTLATWRKDATRRVEGDVYDRNDAVLGARLVRAAAASVARLPEPSSALARQGLDALAERLEGACDLGRLAAALAALGHYDEILARRPLSSANLAVARSVLQVQRELAACSSWYECFPRSASPDPRRPGTLLDLVDRVSYVADLGFDVLYLPPIHPIGMTARKGRNNAASAVPGDVGSPWAIGSASGGHTAVAAELGTIEDFDLLVAEAHRHGLEVALDLAFQCSPDHPWVLEHPDWFAHNPDGTLARAENPPKRYEDVVPFDFSTPERDSLYEALLEVVRFWMAHGVRVFRVDNPHTKPFELWEWLIEAVHRQDPGVVFLSEAFTRPKVMHRLAKLGFDQSYTYFTWRDSKQELADYLQELDHGPGATYFRANLWPNTPDILARSLQQGGRPAFVTRLVLAACGAANYGIYGPPFELLVDEALEPGSEEYLNSEKYEVRHWDLDDPRSIAQVIRRVNAARRRHLALRRDGSLRVHPVDNDALLCWSKGDVSAGDVVVCVVNLDWRFAQSGFVELDLEALGLERDRPFELRDLLEDVTYTWSGGRNYVLLEPARDNVHVLALSLFNPLEH